MIIEKQHKGCHGDLLIGCPLKKVCRLAQNLQSGSILSRTFLLTPAYRQGNCPNFIADAYYGD